MKKNASRNTVETLSPTRRKVIQGVGLTTAQLSLVGFGFPSISYAASRPLVTHGVQTGDVTPSSAVIWSRADKPSKMWLEISATSDFAQSTKLPGPYALPQNDFTSKMRVTDLIPGQTHYFRVTYQGLDDNRSTSEAYTGQFVTASNQAKDITFVWSGDVAGQGWGINEQEGGMTTFATMLKQQPDFFIHSGDTIYADGPISAEVELPDGSIWTNLVTEEVSKVAESIAEFRGRYKYNLMDQNVLEFNRHVPIFAQWDDHETVNNWYPSEILEDDRYQVKNVDLLSARANEAFLNYMPISREPNEPSRIYRHIPYGPQIDIFMLDMRSYRGKNSENRQDTRSEETDFLGAIQIEWLKKALKESTSTWKIIGSDMPIGMMVRDGERAENGANGDGPVLGREFDIAEILKFIKDENIQNVVWLTADVHYTAAHYYDPNQAQFQDFTPFWEFVTGPINAGTFGPSDMDNTFGPQVEFFKAPPEGQANLSPKAGLQFFGRAKIDGESNALTISLMDSSDQVLYEKVLEAQS